MLIESAIRYGIAFDYAGSIGNRVGLVLMLMRGYGYRYFEAKRYCFFCL